VRDSSGGTLTGAEVILANKRVLTDLQGSFRIDSIEVGTHLMTIRLLGYTVVRTRVTIQRGSLHYDYVLRSVTLVLPTLHVEGRRLGIYGTVGDTNFKPLAAVRVQLAGRNGGEVVTDSTGHFAFSVALEGQYVLRTIHPGYAEYRLFVELKRSEGVELAIRLRPSGQIATRADELAVYELGRRLVANLRGDRLNAGQLERYGSRGICQVMGIAARLRAQADQLTIILNGTLVLENMSMRDLCSWHADEVELVEFGESICRDVTRTLVDMLNVWCTRFNERPGVVEPGGGGRRRLRTQRQGGPFVVIWEKR